MPLYRKDEEFPSQLNVLVPYTLQRDLESEKCPWRHYLVYRTCAWQRKPKGINKRTLSPRSWIVAMIGRTDDRHHLFIIRKDRHHQHYTLFSFLPSLPATATLFYSSLLRPITNQLIWRPRMVPRSPSLTSELLRAAIVSFQWEIEKIYISYIRIHAEKMRFNPMWWQQRRRQQQQRKSLNVWSIN